VRRIEVAKAKKKTVPQRAPAQARVVYTQPPITLASVIGREGTRYRVRVGANESLVELDPGVDPALIEEALAGGTRVVVDPGAQTICGVLTTSRAITVDRDGDVRADVRRFEVTSKEGVLLKTPSSFVQLDRERLELFASETVARARDAFRVLAQIIKLN
jgi:hypothetical protein